MLSAGDVLAPLTIAATLVAGGIGLVVLTRFGVFAYLVITMALFVAIAAYGFVLSTGGQLTFRDPVLD